MKAAALWARFFTPNAVPEGLVSRLRHGAALHHDLRSSLLRREQAEHQGKPRHPRLSSPPGLQCAWHDPQPGPGKCPQPHPRVPSWVHRRVCSSHKGPFRSQPHVSVRLLLAQPASHHSQPPCPPASSPPAHGSSPCPALPPNQHTLVLPGLLLPGSLQERPSHGVSLLDMDEPVSDLTTDLSAPQPQPMLSRYGAGNRATAHV